MTTTRAASSVIATDLFSSWAREGLDEKMAGGHRVAVEEMLEASRPLFPPKYSFLDIGCGNGWVVRAESEKEGCELASGVDGAQDMITKAKSLITNTKNQMFHHSDLLAFRPPAAAADKYDVVFSMEVLYYLSDAQVQEMLARLASDIVKKHGLLVFGVDHYLGEESHHITSHRQSFKCGCSICLLPVCLVQEKELMSSCTPRLHVFLLL